MKLRFSVDGLAVRFSLLLTVALIAATLIAAALLYADRARQDRANLIEREVQRIVSLVPAIEAARPGQRQVAARRASTRFSRVSVDPHPVVDEMPIAPRSVALARELRAALGDRDVRAAIMVRGRNGERRGREAVALSIRLRGDGGAEWLNSVSRGGRPGGPPGIPGKILLLALGISLLSVLGVALFFVRRLTRPLKDLAAAAGAAGRGDRSVRVAETGPRELRAASAAFNDMQDRIARFDAERMRTLAAVGHDLRTPITGLRIRAEMLEEEDAAPMIRTLDEMTVMADGLVTYARGAGDAERAQPVNLAGMLSRLCDERGVQFTRGDGATVSGRPVALGRAIGNIVDNAIRYGDGAHVALARDDASAIITIEDEGPGVAPDRLRAVFEPFVRGEDSRSTETGGAGLGLAIARNIVISHGGEISLENRASGGLRATILLPLSA
nr:ATP-binding protein [Roseovarius spongiae]